MNILGLMSGSSLDGLDMALCRFSYSKDKLVYELLDSAEVTYPDWLIKELKTATQLSAYDLYELEARYSKFLGQCCHTFRLRAKESIDLVASHGHTIFHSPEHHFTTQIGNGGVISQYAQCDVISDFRSSDMAAGGQGAPFAPIADHYLYSDVDIMLNLGGIANLSAKKADGIIAMDVSPANQLLNYLAQKRDLAYDDGGRIAREGRVDPLVLEKMIKKNGLDSTSPRAIDNSWVVMEFLPLLDDLTIEDGLNTSVEFIAEEIFKGVTLAYLKKERTYTMMVTGGGAFNTYLMERINHKMKQLSVRIVKADEETIMYKEAILMALMGYLRVEGKVNVFNSYTGARRNTIGGCIYVY